MRQVKQRASSSRSTFTPLIKFIAGAYLACSAMQSAYAAPHFGDAFNLAQPDGSLVPVNVYGDEYYQRIETPDGYTLVRNDAGWIVYAEQNSAGNLVPSSSVYIASGGVGGVNVSSFNKAAVKKSLTDSEREQDRIRSANTQKFNSDSTAGVSGGVLAVNDSYNYQPVVGEIRGLTILIDFSDEQAVIPQSDIDVFFNGINYTGYDNNGSIRDYFYDVSGGKLTYTNDVTVYYRAQNPKTYYDTDQASRARELLQEALDWLEASNYDFSQLTLDSNGQIRGLNVFYAGEPTQGWSNGLWPHSGYYSVNVGGVKTVRYQMTNIGDDLSIAVTCHENGHMLMGWPDLYNKSGAPSRGIGIYGLMAGYASSKNPLPPNPYNRALASWQEPTYISSMPGEQTVTLPSNSYVSYAYENPDDEYEFFMFESIQKTDPTSRYYYAPGEGVLIWHIDEGGNNSNEDMTEALHYKVSVEQADGAFDLERNVNSGDAADFYTNNSFKNFDAQSIPNSNWWSGSDSGLSLSNFSAPGASVSVDVSVQTVGWTQYEAEDQTFSQAVIESINSGFTGVGYVNTDNVSGSWIEFSVDLPYEGLYTMRVRYANGASVNRPVEIVKNGEFISQTLEFAYTGSWVAWEYENFSLNMQAGVNTLRLVSTESTGAANIDNLQIIIEEVENLPPVLSNPIGDVVVSYGETFLIDLNTVFTDPEGGELDFSRESSDDESPNLMFENPTQLRVSGLQEGTETHYIIAADEENALASDSFSLTVLPANQFYVELQMEDQNWQNGEVESDHSGYTGTGYLNTENASGTWVELEVEAPSQGQYVFGVRYANGSVDRPQQVEVNGTVAHSSVSFAPTGGWTTWLSSEFEVTLAAGTNYIRLISLGANGAANLDSFTVALVGGNDNNAPVIVSQKSPVTVSEVGEDYVHDMSVYFSDPDGDTLGFSASSSDTSVVSVSLDDSVIIISGEGVGSAVVSVTATDGEYSVTMTFDASVAALNKPPVVVNPINDISVALGSASYVIDLNSVFNDPDGDTLTFDRDSSNSDSPNLSFTNNATALEISADELGTEWHEIIAYDGEYEVSIQFNLTVVETNQAPVVVNPINDITVALGSASYVIDLNNVFNDPDGDVLSFDRDGSYTDSPNVRFVNNGTALEINAVELGTEWHEVIATDGEYDVSIQFDVTVVSSNQPPVVVNAIDDISLVQGSASYVIDLNAVFSDPDGNPLSFDRDSSYSDSPNVRFVNGATALEINATELGTEWHEVTANDGEFTVTIRFDVTVTAANLPPVIDNPIADVQMNLGDAAITVDLNTVFSDPEGGALTFDHYPMDEELDDVTLLAGGVLQIDADYAGTNSHTIYAIDDQGADVELTFNVTVVAGGGYSAVLEAEDQTWLNATVDTNHAGYTGAGFVNTVNATGTWFRVTIDVPTAGDYNFAVRYANGSTSRAQQVDVDGDAGPLLSFDNSGGWASWVDEVFTVQLSPGVHVITFTSTTSGGAPNLDSIEVTLQ